METDSLKWVGSSCGLHGPYVFYKAFKFYRDGKARILSLGDFFLVRCTPEDPICIAELQLLWEERTTKQLLSSSKLYFLPEDTPAGRTVNHGEDEVIGVSEKVILRLEDLVKWTAGDLSGWVRGRRAAVSTVAAAAAAAGAKVVPKMAVLRELGTNGRREPHLGGRHTHLSSRFSISFRDVLREKAQIGEDEEERTKVLVLSYPQYCRYRCVVARLRGGSEVAVVTDCIIRALGGIGPLHGDVRILYCRETFQHPTLGHNESVCEHFAPNLKGRPRKRKLSQRRENQDSNQNQNPDQALQNGPQSQHPARTGPELRSPPKVRPVCRVVVAKARNGGMCKRVSAEEKREERRRQREKNKKEEKDEKEDKPGTDGQKTEEQDFLVSLYEYMKKRKTPIERIPYLGFKQINLWTMFQTAQKLGGYEQITAHRQWKQVYDELGGHPGSTSAATCTRRHYERLLLPYERYSQGPEERPGVKSRPIKVELVSVTGSKDKGSSPRCHTGGPAPSHHPQSDTEPQHPAVSDDRGGLQCSLQLKGASRNRKIKKEEEEEELQVTVKQEEPLPTQALHHDNQHPGNQIHTDLPLQIDQKHPPSPPPDPPEGHHQEGRSSRSSLSKGATLAPQAHRQATSPGHHPQPALGVAERIPEKEGPPLEPGKDSPPGSLNSSRGCERSSLNAQSGPYFSAPHCVMSPLAKKKLLSQVCVGGGVAQVPPAAPPAVARSDAGELGSSGRAATSTPDPTRQELPAHPASPEPSPVSRPSVIQHAQSFRPSWGAGDGRTTQRGSELCPRGEAPLQGRFLPCPPSRISSTSESSTHHRTEPQERVQRPWEGPQAQPPAQPPHRSGFRGEACYSSPHLQSLYRHTKHRLSQQQQQQHYLRAQMCLSGDRGGGGQRREVTGLLQNVPDVVIDEGHSTPPPRSQLRCHRGPAAVNTQVVDRPADLSVPKTPLSSAPFGGHTYPTMHRDCRMPAPIQPCLDAHDIACKGFPVPIREASLAYKALVPVNVGGLGGVKRRGGLSQTLEDVRAAKRPLEDPENRAPQTKTRPLSPPHPCRETPVSSRGGTRVSERQGEEAEPPEPARAVHLNSYSSQGHRYPPHAPHLGSLCPVGTLGAQEACEGPQVVGYPPPHPLAFLKSQGGAMPAMVAPPFMLHALMMQGQLVRSSTPTPLYQASSANAGGRLSEPHGLHPLRHFSTPQAYPTPQLPAVQPSTKL